MGRFDQKGLCYSFEILHGLLTHKNNRIQMGKKFWGPPQPSKIAVFGWTKAEMGCFSQKGLCYSFEILQGLLSNKNIKIPMKKIFGGFPLYPQSTLFWPEKGEIWWNQLCRHACRKISASADGGLSRGSHVRGHRSEDPKWHRRSYPLMFAIAFHIS